MPEADQEKAPEKKKISKKWILILFGAGAGIFLLLMGSGWFTQQKSEEADTSAASLEALEAYRMDLEKRIADLCEDVEGVDHVRVAVTLCGGFETVYATETKNGIKSYITIGNGSYARPLTISQNPPEIAGIGIVCRGGGNAAVSGKLTALLSSAFHVATNRISIAEAD